MLLLTADSSPNGLGERAQAAGINTTAITARHWRKSLSGLRQFRVDHRAAAPLLQQATADFRPDLVHCNGIRAALLYRMAMPEASRRLPVVIHDRDCASLASDLAGTGHLHASPPFPQLSVAFGNTPLRQIRGPNGFP